MLVRWDSSGSTGGPKDIGIQQDVTATTDATGHYLIVLPPGFYDVFVSAQAFTPAAAKVRVNTGRRSTFNARLNADPLITNELGDRFLPAGIEAPATLPVVKSAEMPAYPNLARLARIEGTARIKVSTDGNSIVRIAADGAHKMLLGAAQENLKTWRFYPHKPQTFTLTFIFKLEPPEVYGPVNPTIQLDLPTRVEIRTKMPTVETVTTDKPE